MPAEEHELLERAARLDEAALAMIFDQYYDAIYRYIYIHVRHAMTAEDLAADVFKRLLEALERGEGPDRHLKAWLYRVARNLFVDESRRQRHRDHAELEDGMAAAGADVPAQAVLNTLQRDVLTALHALTPRQREVVSLRFIEGLTNEEVPRAMGLPVGAVKALQHRGLAALRRAMQGAEVPLEGIR